MAGLTDAERLTKYEQRYRELAATVAELGFIASGTVLSRQTRCGTKTCRCHDDPTQLHGPYSQHTAKKNGKTVTRTLNEHEAALYQEWINNDRQLRRTITEMRDTAAKAQKVLLKKVATTNP